MTFELWPLQELAVERIVGVGVFLEADDMGLGKTATGLTAANKLHQKLRIDRVLEGKQAPTGDILAITLKSARGQFVKHLELLGIDLSRVTITHWEDLLERYRAECEACEGTKTITRNDPGDPEYWVSEDCEDCNGRGYSIRTRPNTKYTGRRWACVIADEAHKAKNRKAKQTLALKHIPTDAKIAMTGTAIVNSPEDLWSILNWLDPKKWSAFWKFYNRYVLFMQHTLGVCDACGKWHNKKFREVIGVKNRDELIDSIRPYFIRRKKKRCESQSCVTELGYAGIPHDHLPDLPDFLEPVTLEVELTPQQRKAYDQMREDSLAWVGQYGEEDPIPAPIAISQLGRLRQFAGAYMEVQDTTEVSVHDYQVNPAVYTPSYRMTEPSSKLDALMDIIEGTDEPIVVFSMSTQLIDLARARFEKAGIEHFWLTGKTPDKNRNDWQRFQAGERQVFIANIIAGGQGIDLFRASTVVFLDRAWTPKDNDQARDRLWRNGQVKGVQQVYIVAKDTVDEELPEKLEFKAGMIREILGG